MQITSTMAAIPSRWRAALLYWKHEPFCGHIYRERSAAGAIGWRWDHSGALCGEVPSHARLDCCRNSLWQALLMDVETSVYERFGAASCAERPDCYATVNRGLQTHQCPYTTASSMSTRNTMSGRTRLERAPVFARTRNTLRHSCSPAIPYWNFRLFIDLVCYTAPASLKTLKSSKTLKTLAHTYCE